MVGAEHATAEVAVDGPSFPFDHMPLEQQVKASAKCIFTLL